MLAQVATSATLQAISVLVTLGSLFIFLFKLIWPGIKFLHAAVTKGFKRAYVTSLRSTMKRVRYDARDVRLIVSRIGPYLLFSMAGLLVPSTLTISLLSFVSTMKDAGLYQPGPVKFELLPFILAFVVVTPFGAALSYLTLGPIFRLVWYCWLMRRRVARQLRKARP